MSMLLSATMICHTRTKIVTPEPLTSSVRTQFISVYFCVLVGRIYIYHPLNNYCMFRSFAMLPFARVPPKLELSGREEPYTSILEAG